MRIWKQDVDTGEANFIDVPDEYLRDVPKENSQARQTALAKAFRRAKAEQQAAQQNAAPDQLQPSLQSQAPCASASVGG